MAANSPFLLPMCRWLGSGLVGVCLAAAPLGAEETPDKDKAPKPPELKLSVPLAIPHDYQGMLILRGQRLQSCKEVKSAQGGVTVKLVKAEASKPPQDVEASVAGDSFVELELQLSAPLDAGEIPLTVVTDQGEATYQTQVIPREKYLEQREPAGGFKDAQDLPLDQVVVGKIDAPRDVDVFRLQLMSGKKYVLELSAARRGSPLDAHLTLFDDRGRILVVNDDAPGTRDPRLEYTVATDGVYYLSVIDANDLGSNIHDYVLSLRAE
ncbi:MAG: PPC domain-containing protein [Pirellulales bacterium]|nr:PPC domain-containing protein [Pirellulales bacterium]